MNRILISVGVTFFFIVTSVSPMVIGYKSGINNDDISSENEDMLDNLAFMCYDEHDNNSKYELYKEHLLNEYSNNDLDDDKIVEPVELYAVSSSDGPMDSAWPMFGHNARHTGQSPYSTENNPGTEKWRFLEDRWIEGCPVIDSDGIIYISDAWGDVSAIYPNGTVKWKFTTGGQIMGSSPAIAEDGTIYIGSWDWNLYALYPNGTLKWRFHAGDTIASSPVIADDGTIYFGTMGPGSDTGRIYAVYPNGTEKWHYDTGYWIVSHPAIAEDGAIYIGSGDSYLYALYPNGTLRWRFDTGDDIHGHPSIADDGTIYIGSWDDYLYALYPNGTMKWSFHTEWGTSNNQAIGDDGTIYVGTDKLYAIYPNGDMKWEFDLGSNRWIGKSSPAISADGTIYVGTHISEMSGGDIIAVNPDGTEQWRKRIASEWVESSPSIGEDGTIYIGSSSDDAGYGRGCLHAFNYFELETDAHGPYIGIMNEPVQFTGSADGGYPPYRYHWDFGDEETSEEQNPTHEYTSAGNYTVTFTVTDDNDSVDVDTTWALIRESNDPPGTPNIEGETHGYYGESYDYTFIATDPDGDDIWYFIEWGDESNSGWIGPYDSGEEVIKSHTWDDEGTYNIRAKAKDIFDAEGEWGILEVTMPINQQSTHPWFTWLLERFPNAFPILRQIFRL